VPLPYRGHHGLPAAARQVHVEQDHVRLDPGDQLDGRADVVRFPDYLDGPAEFGPDTRPEEPVVVHQQYPRHAAHQPSPS
jgi:hypothetical protein